MDCPDAQSLLWRYLKRSHMGVKFLRQQPVEEYVFDFVSFAPRLVIELDRGEGTRDRQHEERRLACLRRNRFLVLRFWDKDIRRNLKWVLKVIRQHCLCQVSPSPAPLPKESSLS